MVLGFRDPREYTTSSGEARIVFVLRSEFFCGIKFIFNRVNTIFLKNEYIIKNSGS